MFYYRITRTRKIKTSGGYLERVDDKMHREYTGTVYLGSDLATMLAQRDVVSLRVSKISQAVFIRATRPGA